MITGAIVNAGDIEVSGSNSGTNDAFVVGKVFVDYDGRLGSRLQEHSVSGGLKLRF